mmetsp:Transcript_20199/g.26298  ORF Transcript_20199/g.26298 Transcript_20199/m.26298 type:complete len:90 (+) Transcript_20199:1-270(+)
MLGILSAISFDFIAFECFKTSAGSSYYFTVYLWCLLPIVLMVITCFSCMIQVLRQRHLQNNISVHEEEEEEEEEEEIKRNKKKSNSTRK